MGGDWFVRIMGVLRLCFNPHLHVGGDFSEADKNVTVTVSIHTSTWEVTAKGCRQPPRRRVSIHTSTWEVTKDLSAIRFDGDVSIHTSTWEVTAKGIKQRQLDPVSIHTSTWEVTCYKIS